MSNYIPVSPADLWDTCVDAIDRDYPQLKTDKDRDTYIAKWKLFIRESFGAGSEKHIRGLMRITIQYDLQRKMVEHKSVTDNRVDYNSYINSLDPKQHHVISLSQDSYERLVYLVHKDLRDRKAQRERAAIVKGNKTKPTRPYKPAVEWTDLFPQTTKN